MYAFSDDKDHHEEEDDDDDGDSDGDGGGDNNGSGDGDYDEGGSCGLPLSCSFLCFGQRCLHNPSSHPPWDLINKSLSSSLYH